MAEKRKLPARERREPAAKRRASEATPQQTPQTQSSSKKKASTPPPPPEPAVIAPPLPIKIKDGEGLPTLPTPQQVASLSDKDYQSIAESAVLLASLERSKKKWLSDGILVRYWTKPKKTKREQIEGKNPPKESMSKVGPCHIMVGPHLFDCMLYTVKDPNAPPPIQYTPPQRPMVHYGHPNNFQQYHPYPPPPPPQHTLPPQQHHPQTIPPGPPPPGYQPRGQPMRPPSQQGRAPGQMSPPAHAPPPGPQQRLSPSQPAQPQPAKPNPDPVIQMLATRAASDPELKALMRVVASTEATQEQLRAFQAHIDELNAIIRAREQRQRQRQQQQQATPTRGYTGPSPSPAPPVQAQPPPPPQQSPPAQQIQSKPQPMQQVEVQIPRHSPSGNPPPQTPSQQPASQPQPPAPQTQVKQESGAATPTQPPSVHVPPPGPNPGVAPGAPPVHPNSKQPSPAVRPMPQPPPPQAAGPRPGAPYPPYQQPPYQGQPPSIHSRPPQYGSPATYYRQAPLPPPPRLNYKSVVFEFTSPLTPYGSSTSGHAGSGDRYLFPEYTILDWLPGGNTVLASFLVVRKVDPNTPFPLETATEIANSRAKGKSAKSKKSDKKKKGDDKGKEEPKPNPDPSSTAPDSKTATEDKPTEAQDRKDQPTTTDPNNPDSTPKPEDKKEPVLKEYYQPVTFRITSSNPKVLEPLARVVKPADEVRKYMNEIMDRAERAPDGFLAVRLPREGSQHETVHVHEGEKGTPVVSGSRKFSRGKNVVVEQEDVVDTENEGVEEEEEEELKDYYGPPTGLSLC